MSELEPTVQPVSATPPVEAPVAPPAPETPPPTPAPAPAGPTLEQLNEELAQTRQLISQADERAKRAEYESQYTRNLLEQGFGRGKPQAESPTVQAPTNDDWITNPGEAGQRLLESYRAQDKKEREQRDREQYVEKAKSYFETGKKTALTPSNKLMAGIEREVESEIQQGIISGAIHPEAATELDLWNMAAIAYRYKVRGERNFDKYLGSTATVPMTSAHTETPTASAPPKAVPVLTELEKTGARFFGVTDEQWAATKRTEGK